MKAITFSLKSCNVLSIGPIKQAIVDFFFFFPTLITTNEIIRLETNLNFPFFTEIFLIRR